MKHQLYCNYAKINSARKYEFDQCAKINGAKIHRAKIGGARKKMGFKVPSSVAVHMEANLTNVLVISIHNKYNA